MSVLYGGGHERVFTVSGDEYLLGEYERVFTVSGHEYLPGEYERVFTMSGDHSEHSLMTTPIMNTHLHSQ